MSWTFITASFEEFKLPPTKITVPENESGPHVRKLTFLIEIAVFLRFHLTFLGCNQSQIVHVLYGMFYPKGN
jgi:hypothetical protein